LPWQPSGSKLVIGPPSTTVLPRWRNCSAISNARPHCTR
jgi:hypothetical protein